MRSASSSVRERVNSSGLPNTPLGKGTGRVYRAITQNPVANMFRTPPAKETPQPPSGGGQTGGSGGATVTGQGIQTNKPTTS